jgi:hypothetical protein
MTTPERPPELILRQLLRDRPDEITDIALAARQLVLKCAGDCCEMIYEVYCISDAFSFTGKLGQAFIHIASYGRHVNLGFNRGTELDDPHGRLCGNGKLMRHVRLESLKAVNGRDVKRLVMAAVAQGRQMAEQRGGPVTPFVAVHRKGQK